MLRIEVSTNETGTEEAYIFKLKVGDPDKLMSEIIDVLLAIETLYGREGVQSVYIATEEEEEEEVTH